MNNILTNSIVDPSIQQPFTGRSLAFLQNANKEMVRGICESILGSTLIGTQATTGVAISGCTLSGSGDTMFYGFIYFNNELFYFPGVTGLNSFSYTAYFDYDTTNDPTADPVIFTDLVSRNVHNVRRLKVVDSPLALQFPLSSLVNMHPSATNLSVINGWTNFSTAEATLNYPIVRLKGIVTGTLGSPTSTVMFNLPSQYRPSTQKIIGIAINDGGTYEPGLIRINTNGDVDALYNVSVSPPLPSGTLSFYLDSISFNKEL